VLESRPAVIIPQTQGGLPPDLQIPAPANQAGDAEMSLPFSMDKY